MGAAISTVRSQVEAVDRETKERTMAQLDFLVHAANSKLDKYQQDLDEMFTNPASVEKKAVPGIRAMRWNRGYRVGVDRSSTDGGLGEVINGFFGVAEGATGVHKNQAIIDGFKNVVSGSLSAILGNCNAGEQEEQKFFIFMEHNAVIRIDVKIWRYNFNNRGIMANTENVFCYVFCTSVVDSSTLKLDELSFLLSEYSGDNGVHAYVDKLLQVWTSIHKMHAFIQGKAITMDAVRTNVPKMVLPATVPEKEHPARKA